MSEKNSQTSLENTPAEVHKPASISELRQYVKWKESVPRIFRTIIEGSMQGKGRQEIMTGRPRLDFFLNECAREMQGAEHDNLDLSEEQKSIIQNLLEPLKDISTQEGRKLNGLRALVSGQYSWQFKTNLYETQIAPDIEWLIVRDDEEQEKNQEAQNKQKNIKPSEEENGPQTSAENKAMEPPSSDEVHSSMETGVSSEKAPTNPHFLISPFYRGRYEQITHTVCDLERFVWKRNVGQFAPVTPIAVDPLLKRTVFGGIHKGKSVLAVPEGWMPLPNSLTETDVHLMRDTYGVFEVQADQSFNSQYELDIAPRQMKERKQTFESAILTAELPQEVVAKIAELKSLNLPPMKIAREIVKFIRSSLIYSNNPDAFAYYISAQTRQFSRVWERKEADCFVANTLAVAALCKAGFKAKFVSGYNVNQKNEKGMAVLHAGNAHAWLKVFDEVGGIAIDLDATPKGDPNADEEQQEKELEGGKGDEEAEAEDAIMSDDEARDMLEEFEREQGEKKEKETSPLQIRAEKFSEKAHCTKEEATEYLEAISLVRKIKNEKGEAISGLLKKEWKKLIQERVKEVSEYRGPVRMSEGDSIDDTVETYLDVRSGERDPSGFERERREEQKKFDFGGINLYFSFDLSASMKKEDPASGRQKSEVQRDAGLLFADSVMQCAIASRRTGINVLPIKIMAAVAKSTGLTILHLTDTWDEAAQWAFYKGLNETISDNSSTATHESLQCIETDLLKDKNSLAKNRTPKHQLPLSYVVNLTDGEPDSFGATETMQGRLTEHGAIVRQYQVGGRSRSAYASDPIASFVELAQILSSDITEQFKKLAPTRVKK